LGGGRDGGIEGIRDRDGKGLWIGKDGKIGKWQGWGMCGRWFRKQVVASFCSTIVQYSKVTGGDGF